MVQEFWLGLTWVWFLHGFGFFWEYFFDFGRARLAVITFRYTVHDCFHILQN